MNQDGIVVREWIGKLSEGEEEEVFKLLNSKDAISLPEIKRKIGCLNEGAAKILIENGRSVIVDTRSREEFATGHIVKSVNIPIAELEVRSLNELDEKTSLVVIGNTLLAREILENSGWKDIAAICGNLESWRQDGLPLNPQ